MTTFPENIARKAILDFVAYSARGGSTGALHLDANKMDKTTSSFVRQLLDIIRPARKFRAPALLMYL